MKPTLRERITTILADGGEYSCSEIAAALKDTPRENVASGLSVMWKSGKLTRAEASNPNPSEHGARSVYLYKLREE